MKLNPFSDPLQLGPSADDMDRVSLENKLIRQEMIQLTDEIGMLSNKMRSYQVDKTGLRY